MLKYLVMGGVLLVFAGLGLSLSQFAVPDGGHATWHVVWWVSLAFAVLVAPLVWLVVEEQTLGRAWVLLAVGGFLLLIYSASTKNRVWSYHGMMHGAVVGQILQTGVPPTNPFLANQPLYYPWGYAWLVAVLCQNLPISIDGVFAAINIVSLVVVFGLTERIARILVDDRRAALLAAYIALFGTTIMDSRLMGRLSQWLAIPWETRAVPASLKFSNVNGVPLGLVFFSLVLYALLSLVAPGERRARYGWPWLVLCGGLLGEGFFYPAMLFGTAAAILAVCAVSLVVRGPVLLGRVVGVLALSAGCAVVLLPYLGSISGGLRQAETLSSLRGLQVKGTCAAVMALPLLILITVYRHPLRATLGVMFWVLLAVAAAAIASYWVMVLPAGTEYKSMILAFYTLGILGGIALTHLQNQCGKIPLVVALILLMIPSYSLTLEKLLFMEKLPAVGVQDAWFYQAADVDERDLYQWIREHTAVDSVFIDTSLMVPAAAARRLWVGARPEQWRRSPGFTMGFLDEVWGYDPALLAKRRDLSEQLLAGDRRAIRTIRETMPSQDIYVVVRSVKHAKHLEAQGFHPVYASGDGRLALIKLHD